MLPLVDGGSVQINLLSILSFFFCFIFLTFELRYYGFRKKYKEKQKIKEFVITEKEK